MRLDAPSVLHHIIIRGIERRNIFRDNKDRDNFIDRLSDLLPATQTTCYAWAFIPNHAHFLFRSSGKISTLMRRLLTGYAIYCEKKGLTREEDRSLQEVVWYAALADGL